MPTRSSPELERDVRRPAARGCSRREIGRSAECSHHAVANVLAREPRPPAATDWNPSPARLSVGEREETRAGLEHGDGFTAIARVIGRSVPTGRVRWRPTAAGTATGPGRPPGCPPAGQAPEGPEAGLRPPRAQVTAWLEEWWSPEEIARRLRLEFPDDRWCGWATRRSTGRCSCRSRRAPPPAAPLPAQRTRPAPATQPLGDPRSDPRHGHLREIRDVLESTSASVPSANDRPGRCRVVVARVTHQPVTSAPAPRNAMAIPRAATTVALPTGMSRPKRPLVAPRRRSHVPSRAVTRMRPGPTSTAASPALKATISRRSTTRRPSTR